jgi:uncharacterized coiled-coil DUF342 family protein
MKQNKLEKEHFNMSNIAKANLLQQAMDKLQEADVLVQQALGASDECYSLHNKIENIAEEVAEYAEQLIEMQVTE